MKKGFTLAEVLVTLSIVGVIAILTIPSLVKNYRYKIYSTSIEKAYSQISAAAKQAMDDDMTNDWYKSTSGAVDDNENCTKGSCYFLNNYFKLARKNCGGTTSPKCFADTYTNLDGSSGNLPFERGYCAQTVNGMTMCMNIDSEKASTKIALDTNGPSQPNIVGIDTFILQIPADGAVKDWSDDPTLCNGKTSEYNNIADYATGCLVKVMRNNWTITDDN